MSFKNDAPTYVAGAGAYFLLVGIFAFYPAFIIGMAISRMVYGVVIDTGISSMSDEYFAATGVHIIATIVIALIIWGLIAARQWFVVLALYLITLWPFLYMLGHWWRSAGNPGPELFPLPLDWCFLF
jgi:hypothetical protein